MPSPRKIHGSLQICLIGGVTVGRETLERVALKLIADLFVAAAREKEKDDAHSSYVAQHPDMSWSSTKMMEEGLLDHHFGMPLELDAYAIQSCWKVWGRRSVHR